MKIIVYWLTTERHNSGTDTSVFGSMEALQDDLRHLMLEDIPGALTSSEEDTVANAKECARFLEVNKFEEAWEVYRDNANFGENPVHHYDDCFWWGEQEIEVHNTPAKRALEERV